MEPHTRTIDGEPDEQLIERLQNGDESAFDIIIDRYGKEIFNFHLRHTGNYEDANDLSQETFVRLYINKNKFSKEYKFKTWLYTIAMNLLRNHYRWKRRHLEISIDAASDEDCEWIPDIAISTNKNPSAESINYETQQAIDKAMNSLTEEQRDVIILCELQDLSLAEAAKVLNTTIKSVESHLYRARKALRQKLKDYLE
ncbi:MAG: RNA polymerase sigma factor [Verrucomicrobiia bacterium]